MCGVRSPAIHYPILIHYSQMYIISAIVDIFFGMWTNVSK